MNIFVLCTGRCGSTTFIRACQHIENFTAAHESRTSLVGEARFAYPVNHIEADNRLSWMLGRLDAKYGDDAVYVHLTRNDHETAASFVQRYDFGIIKAYRGEGILAGCGDDVDPMTVALDYCHTVNTNIRCFLKHKPRKLRIRLEVAQADFRLFWGEIGATGNLQAALKEFSIRHNASAQPRPRYQITSAQGATELKRIPLRIAQAVKRMLHLA